MPRVYRGSRAYRSKPKAFRPPACPECGAREWMLDICWQGCCLNRAVCAGCGLAVSAES